MKKQTRRSLKSLTLSAWIAGLSSLLVGCGGMDSGVGGVNSMAIGNNNTVITNVGGVMDLGGSGVLDQDWSGETGPGMVTEGTRLRRRGGGSEGFGGCDHGEVPEDFGPGWVAAPGGSSGNEEGGSNDISEETMVTSQGTVVRGRGGIEETPSAAAVETPVGSWEGPIDPDEELSEEEWASTKEPGPSGASTSEGVPELS